jgi:hypothetical protein
MGRADAIVTMVWLSPYLVYQARFGGKPGNFAAVLESVPAFAALVGPGGRFCPRPGFSLRRLRMQGIKGAEGYDTVSL